jgi:hypothetical protein
MLRLQIGHTYCRTSGLRHVCHADRSDMTKPLDLDAYFRRIHVANIPFEALTCSSGDLSGSILKHYKPKSLTVAAAAIVSNTQALRTLLSRRSDLPRSDMHRGSLFSSHEGVRWVERQRNPSIPRPGERAATPFCDRHNRRRYLRHQAWLRPSLAPSLYRRWHTCSGKRTYPSSRSRR